jgi:hypothetical protein
MNGKASGSDNDKKGDAGHVWTRLACHRCTYHWEHPGHPQPGDLDRECPLCQAQLGAVTTYRVSEANKSTAGAAIFPPLC